MHDFVVYLFYLLRSALFPAVLAVLACAVILAISHRLFQRKHKGSKKFPWGRALLSLLLVGYLVVLIYVTLFRTSEGRVASSINPHLFRAFREAWNAFTLQRWLNPLLNVAVFMPLGILLPLMAKPFRRWYATLAAGLGGSLLIEIAQYLLSRGTADVDDLFANTLGTMLGYCLCMAFVSLIGRKGKLFALYSLLPLLSIASLAGVFGIYYIQPYGNLAQAPAYTVNTEDVEWVLECELSNEAGSAGIYWAQPFDRASCASFGEQFARWVGADFSDVSYYDNTTTFMDHTAGYFLHVDLSDRSYSYSGPAVFEGGFVEVGDEELQTALLPFEIEVPNGAEFSYEGRGWHRYQADCIIDGDTLTAGALRCQVAESGAIARLESSLVICGLKAEESIISEADAYTRLCQGKFSNGDYFEYLSPKEVHVLSCTLGYISDTKGFRQPVYLFGLEELGGTVFVPARLS